MILSHFNHYSSSALTSPPSAHETRAMMRGSERLYPLPHGGPGCGAFLGSGKDHGIYHWAAHRRPQQSALGRPREPKFTGEAEHVLGRVSSDLHQRVLPGIAVRVLDQ